MIFSRTNYILPLLIATLACLAGSAEAQSWPRLDGDTHNPQCVDALRLAQAAFQSTNARLYWPVDPPQKLESRIVLKRMDKDISGGGGLGGQTKDFTRISATDSQGKPLTIFWQKEPQGGQRVVAVDQGFNWQGDWYYLYALSPAATADDLAKDFQTEDTAKQAFKPILGSSWNPPLVLVNDKTAVIWFILMGEPYDVLGKWQVHQVRAGGDQMPCTINFRPDVKFPVFLMPAAVRRLAKLLDSTLGSGDNEGTSHPTAYIRLSVAEDWANASLRPWALVDKPWNDRSQVDAGLAQWASVSAARGAIYYDIQQQIPRAEQALTRYYLGHFKLPSKLAHGMGIFVTDFIYRDSFSFPGGDPNYNRVPANNPFPGGLR